MENLLADLDRRARELTDTQHELGLAEEQARTRAAELATRLKGLDKERRTVLEAARGEAGDLLREGRRAIERAVRELIETLHRDRSRTDENGPIHLSAKRRESGGRRNEPADPSLTPQDHPKAA